MKELLKTALIFALLLTAIPMIIFIKPRDASLAAETDKTSVTDAADLLPTAEAFPVNNSDILKVLDFTCGQILELPMRDYVIGAVMAEMPASYHEEALKAQAVAARTYAVRQREKQKLSPNPELMGADISNDSTKFQAYFTPEQAKTFYGDSYETYYEKVAKAVDETGNAVLVYNGEPIVAAFHSTSGGRTESAEIVWGNAVDYLVPVESAEDENSPSYLEEQLFSEAEFREMLKAEYPEANFSEAPETWISIKEKSSSGTVVEMTAGGEVLTGIDFRHIFSLRSANFTVEYTEGQFTVTTRGNGHGVGMSQYGANAMANAGADYKEILLHYYMGAELNEE